MCEVPAREATCGVEEGADLAGERAAHAGRGEHREEEEGDQQTADDQAVLGDGVGDAGGALEEGELHGRAGGLRDALDAGAVLGAACQLQVLWVAEAAEVGAFLQASGSRGEKPVVPVDGGVQAGERLDAGGQRVRAGDRDGEDAERLASAPMGAPRGATPAGEPARAMSSSSGE